MQTILIMTLTDRRRRRQRQGHGMRDVFELGRRLQLRRRRRRRLELGLQPTLTVTLAGTVLSGLLTWQLLKAASWASHRNRHEAVPALALQPKWKRVYLQEEARELVQTAAQPVGPAVPDPAPLLVNVLKINARKPKRVWTLAACGFGCFHHYHHLLLLLLLLLRSTTPFSVLAALLHLWYIL